MFEMFDSSDRDIQLGVTVKLPDQDFLAMLHSNAKDKDKFMDELTEYVFRVINKKVVKDSITKMFETSTSTQRSGEINFTEIHE
jgi:transcriptional regulator CtsR